jgi:predicted O-methyltransferase YrrM
VDHFYIEIPGFFHAPGLYAEAVRQADDGAHFVEIGAWLGQSTAFLAVEIINSGKKIKLDVVDTWPDQMDAPMLKQWVAKYGSARPHFERNIKPVRDAITVYQMPSVEAAKLYQDQSLDFVYIDGDHELESVRADLEAWAPKVKQGGVLAGDDFAEYAVAKAVFERYPDPATITEGGISWMVVL